jgi:N-methylhydantoinase A
VFFGDGFVDTPVYARGALTSGQSIAGPAIVEEDESTLVVPPVFDLIVDAALNLVVDRRAVA